MESKRSGDTFGTFLETLHRGEKAVERDDGVGLVMALRRTGPSTVEELQHAVDLPFQRFAAALTLMEQRGFIAVEGVPGSERVELTPNGLRFASLRD